MWVPTACHQAPTLSAPHPCSQQLLRHQQSLPSRLPRLGCHSHLLQGGRGWPLLHLLGAGAPCLENGRGQSSSPRARAWTGTTGVCGQPLALGKQARSLSRRLELPIGEHPLNSISGEEKIKIKAPPLPCASGSALEATEDISGTLGTFLGHLEVTCVSVRTMGARVGTKRGVP